MPLAARAAAAGVMAVVLAATAMPRDLAAMQFEPLSSDGDMGVVSGRGEIVQGDADRLRNALAVAPAGKRVALLLDSPGGSVREAAQMGRMIRDGTVTVVIPQNSKCVSACFLLLAGATRRFAATDALVGVHSASESGEETVNSLAVTTAMARAAADFGVPAGILGKMVRTVPGRVEWLTHDDLISMGVEILDENGSPRPAQQASSRPPPAASPSSAPTPTQPVAPAPFSRAPLGSVLIAEFHGAYFCAGPATMSLRILQNLDTGRRRAVLAFSPSATNPLAEHGRFMLEGRLDLAGGVLDMQPVAGSSEPTGAPMVGLLGHSDDGGKTFVGRVTADVACSLFTLRRVK